jgi:HD superfamily phosphohydrolase
LSGTIDADKLDYLRRDSYHTGSSYGTFDLERMLSTLTTIKDDSKEYPVILEKGIHVFESFRLARYLLYSQVYQHHARLIADRMFLRSLELAIFKEKKIPKNLFKFYRYEKHFVDKFLEIDDASIYDLVLNKCKSESTAFTIMNDLKSRKLFKRCYIKELSEISSPLKRMEIWKKDERALENEISDEVGVNGEPIIVHKESEEGGLKSYRTFGRMTESGEIPLMYTDRDGKPHLYDERSPITLRKEPSRILYVFAKEEYKNKINEFCKKRFC